jgi:hypothetical protein
MKICFMGKGDFCLCKNRSQTFLLQRKTCPAILVIAKRAARFLSLRWSVEYTARQSTPTRFLPENLVTRDGVKRFFREA